MTTKGKISGTKRNIRYHFIFLIKTSAKTDIIPKMLSIDIIPAVEKNKLSPQIESHRSLDLIIKNNTSIKTQIINICVVVIFLSKVTI